MEPNRSRLPIRPSRRPARAHAVDPQHERTRTMTGRVRIHRRTLDPFANLRTLRHPECPSIVDRVCGIRALSRWRPSAGICSVTGTHCERRSVVSISDIGVGVTDFWCAVHCLSLAPQVYRTGALDEDVLPGLSEGVLCPTACRGRLIADLLSEYGP